jgi:site-specific DNA-methyltransferase (adenine-specific)
MNKVIIGDCLEVMGKLESGSVNLIYLDPPFFTQKNHSLITRDRSKEYSFSDSWNSLEDYLEFMKERLQVMKSLLADDGSIFLHCDTYANHHLRIMLDEIFGRKNFQSEIIWSYKRWSNSAKGLIPNHQNIYFYSKSSDFKFNKLFGEYSETTNVDQILQLRERDINGVTKYAKTENGDVIYGSNKNGVPLGDVWEIPFLNPKAKERVGYPTQKPINLLEKIIELVTDKGDLVLDPFSGSGTTLVASKLMDRRFIGIDINAEAVQLSKSRIANPVKTDSYLLKLGRDSYKNSDTESLAYLMGMELNIVQRNKGIDAFIKDTDLEGIYPVRVQKKNETLDEALKLLIKSSFSKNFKHGYLIRTKFDQTFNFELQIPTWITVIDSIAVQIDNSIKKTVSTEAIK